MEGVQNIRKAIYDYKIRAEAADLGSKKQIKITSVAINYLYRYGTLIVFANYLLEKSYGEVKKEMSFPEWYSSHREIERILKVRSLE